jgi:hypothetical protein
LGDGDPQAPYLIGFFWCRYASLALDPAARCCASYIRAVAVRKWVWILGSLAQAVAIRRYRAGELRMGAAAAGWSIVRMPLVLFSAWRTR